MAQARTARTRFGDHVIDAGARTLTRGGVVVDLEPRTFDVLAYLVDNRDRVVPKTELLDELWGDRFVSESALSTRIKHARAAIDDDGRRQHRIRTAHRVGYQFVAEAEELDGPGPDLPRTGLPDWTLPRRRDLVGRDRDRREVTARLDGHRLVTITGPAGVGKTALAETLIAEVAAPDPIVCHLAETRDPSSVGDVVLRALGHARQGGGGPMETVLRVLERRQGLVLLDNCEHVLAAVEPLVAGLLARCPGVRVLTTSRVPLGLEDESVVVLGPLALDDAVRCFARGAADAGATVEVDDPALVELCERLDGVPLALDLAAARTRVLSPAEMVPLLRDRFRLLRATVAGAERSLHAALATSWDALDDVQQALLADLAVLVGPFTLDDARMIALADADPFDVVDHVERLVRHSLVVARPAERGRTQFQLLDSVRDFVLEQVPLDDDRRRRHVAHFVQRAEHLDARCQTDHIDEAIAELSAIWSNLRAAVGYGLAIDDVDAVGHLLRAVVEVAELRATYEVADWAGRAVERFGDEPQSDLHADTMAVLSRMLAHQGHVERAAELARKAAAAHRSHPTAMALVWSAYYRGDLDTVVELAPQLVELSRSARGFDRGYADGFVAIVAAVRQDTDVTSATVEPDDAATGVLGTLDVLTAGLRVCASDPVRAIALLEAVAETSLAREYRLLLGAAASTLTQVALPSRPPREAMDILRRTLGRYQERGMWNLVVADVVMAARLLADAGEVDLAARLLGARETSGYSVGLSEVLAALLRDELSARLGERADELVAEGRRWRPPDAAEAAIGGLARVLAREEPPEPDPDGA
ncbi:ATP-binding protein [Rhabdothermincola salaria]|uniref:ATP-binding protein n=1 Tax=Rhabdothermincola salaria TaxID=2903142 RepID=UPI001E3B9904|nr:winged helix-turn-helix domain-containing protein [Rhabdothermincola salaria]MCD9623703.1 winged helix-turn-helix domain-containing protein [Rhabdothermincola salaria]